MKKIIPRKLNLLFPSNIPKHWLKGSVFKTHLLNSFTVIFPVGEKFFIRSINKFFKDLEDPVLKKQVKAFIAQETQHYIEHEKFFKNLQNQGYDIMPLVKAIDTMVKKIIEPALGKKMNLATTAGLEHFTALLAEIGLKDRFLDDAHPVMKELFEWHAAEEIEHRCVAYDVLQAVDDSYALRVAGLVNAYLMLFGFSSVCTVYLIAKDRELLNKAVIKDALDTLFFKEALFIKSAQICFRYLEKDFHPSDQDVDSLAEDVFGMGLGVA